MAKPKNPSELQTQEPAAPPAVVDLTMLSDIDAVSTRPASIEQGDLSGTEGIDASEVRLPRVAIAQGLSYEMLPDDSRYIEGLKLFDMFNDMTGAIYGRGPIKFVVARRDIRRIEFAPRDEGGGILDLNVPLGDPRLEWTLGDGGVRQPPRATTFIEFVVLLLRPGCAPEPVVMSIKNTNKFNRRASDQLTSFIKLRNAPIYSGLYTVSTKSEKNDQGTFGVFVVKNAGFIPKDTPAGAALYQFAKEFSEALEGKTIAPPSDADDFDPATLEAESAAQTTAGM